MDLTIHAAQRWLERFPGAGCPRASLGRAVSVHPLAVVFANRRVGRPGTVVRVRQYRYDARAGAVWVVAPGTPGAAVTVFPAPVRLTPGAVLEGATWPASRS